MEELCTLEQAKNSLGVYDDSQDAEIQEAIVMASSVILDYCQIGGTTGLSGIKLECLRAACLRLIPVIYDGPGEKEAKYGRATNELPQSVTIFLGRVKRNIVV